MKIKEVKIESIKPYKNNPRHNDGAVEDVAESIKTFGFQQPLVLDKDHVIIVGHTRWKAAKTLGLDTVPCVVAENLSEEQTKAYRIADNRTGELSEWDWTALEIELEAVGDLFTGFGGGLDEELLNGMGAEEAGKKYKSFGEGLVYEITGERPEESELVDLGKYEYLVGEIEQHDLTEKEATFLKLAAMRHAVFHYDKIAEYYAHADGDVQMLMEDSALVIVDIDKAIEEGFAEMSVSLEELMNDEHGD